MKKNVILALVASLALAGACEKKAEEAKKADSPATTPTDPAKPDSPTPDQPKPAGDTPVTPPADGPTVKLLSPGSAPHQPLRFKVEKGAKQTLVMTMKMNMQVSVGGQQVPATNIPAMKMTMDMNVTEVAPAGDIRYEFVMSDVEVVSEAGVPPQVVDAMKNALKGAKGMSGFAVVSDRGITRSADVTVPPGADPNIQQAIEGMKQSMNQLSAPFPEEPVGVGAKWEVTTNLTQNGMLLKQVATYELTELKESSGTAKLTVVQSADRQKIKAPNMPPGADVELVSLDSKGDGTLNFVLSQLVPSQADLNLESKISMNMEMGGQKQSTNMTMGMKMTMEGK